MQVPRFAGPATYARLPALDAVGTAEVAILGVPFDSGVVYRPGARFGPAAVRAGSRMLRPFNAWTEAEPFARQVADAGDVACTPFSIEQAIGEIEAAAKATYERAPHVLAIGGDHAIAFDVLDPAFAPGTGTPEAGGWSSREAIAVIRGLGGIRLAAADVVEVAPAYDHAEVTAIAAANIVYELLCLFAMTKGGG